MNKLSKLLLILGISTAFCDYKPTYNVYSTPQPTQQNVYQKPQSYYPPEYRSVAFVGASGQTVTLDDESIWMVSSFQTDACRLEKGDLVTLTVQSRNNPGNFILKNNDKDIAVFVKAEAPSLRETPGNAQVTYLNGNRVMLETNTGRQMRFYVEEFPSKWLLNDSITVALEPQSWCTRNEYKYYLYSIAGSQGVRAKIAN